MARPASRVSRVLMTGPLAPFAHAYELELKARRYTPLTRVSQLCGVGKTFRKITISIGVRTATAHPRIHDLRHGFAVRALIGWQRSGADVDEHIAVLSTYLGHVSPADTYWYLSASPELMQLAAEQLHTRPGALR